MNAKKYAQAQALQLRDHEIYRLHVVEKERVSDLMKKFGLSKSGLEKVLHLFEERNPKEAALMKQQKKDGTAEDTQELLREISRLKKELSTECLRADFYEEMVAFGKEVYGIDLKKAGTK